MTGGAGLASGRGMRVTSTPTTVMTPTIIVMVRAVTSRFSKRSEGGSSGSSSGVAVMSNPSLPDDEALILTIGADAPLRLDKALAALVPEDAALSP